MLNMRKIIKSMCFRQNTAGSPAPSSWPEPDRPVPLPLRRPSTPASPPLPCACERWLHFRCANMTAQFPCLMRVIRGLPFFLPQKAALSRGTRPPPLQAPMCATPERAGVEQDLNLCHRDLRERGWLRPPHHHPNDSLRLFNVSADFRALSRC